MTDDRTPFYVEDAVTYTGVAMPPAHGKLLHFASRTAAYVKWEDGVRSGQIDMVSLYDLDPVSSPQVLAVLDPMGHTAVRRAMDAEGEPGVVNFLITAHKVEGWAKIARDALEFVRARLRSDASMQLPYEQLGEDEVDRVVTLASETLLRDAFGELSS